MMLRPQLFASLGFLLIAVAIGPALAQDAPKDDANKEVLKQIAELKKAIEDLKLDLEQSRKSTELVNQNAKKEIENLRKEIEDLRKAMKDAGTTRTANFPPGGEGKVILRNKYPQTVDVMVNGVSYSVRPNEDYEIKLPTGRFTFRVPVVPGYQTDQARLLGTEKPYIITIE